MEPASGNQGRFYRGCSVVARGIRYNNLPGCFFVQEPRMDNPAAHAESLNIEQLLHLHTLTKEVAKLCQKQLRGYLDTMALLFRPRRLLGDAMEGAERESVAGSDRNVAELRDLYRKVAPRPFDLRPELTLPLESVSTQMQFYDWEYLHQTKTDRGWRSIKVYSPL